MDRDTSLEIAAALLIMVVAVWFVGPVLVIVVAFLIYLPTLGMRWYKRQRKDRERKLTKP